MKLKDALLSFYPWLVAFLIGALIVFAVVTFISCVWNLGSAGVLP